MSQERTWDYGAPRRTRLLNRRFLDVIPSRTVIEGFDVTATSPASLSLNIGAGILIDQDGVVIKETTALASEVTIVPHLTYPRIDWVVAAHTYSTANGVQTYTVLQGTAGSPPIPPVLEAHTVKLAEVWVPANAFALTQDLIYPVVKSSIDNTVLSRTRLGELQPISTSHMSLGISDKILVRGGTYVNSVGAATVQVSDQLSSAFGPVTSGNERIDIVTLDDNGVLGTETGIEQPPGFAEPPSYPIDKQVVAEVFVNETADVLISPSDITDTRFFFNLGGGGGGGGGITEVERYDTIATSNQTLFPLPWSYTPGKNQILVVSSGVFQTKFSDYTESSGTTVTFVSGRVAGEPISVIRIGTSSSTPARIALRELYVATAGQTIFPLAGIYLPASNSLMVFRNGKKLVLDNDYIETSSSVVTLTSAATLGDEYEFVVSGSTSDWITDTLAGTAKSLLVNGGFKTWQRGIGPFSTNATAGPDEWVLMIGSGCAMSVFPNTTSMKYGPQCAQINVSKGSGVIHLEQGIESCKGVEGATLTFSLWINTSVASCARIGIGDYNGVIGDFNYSGYHTGSGGWERLVVTKTIRSGVAPYLGAPHDFGVWVFIDFGASASGVLVDGGMLAIGTFSAGLIYTPIGEAEEIERCQRFYQSGTDGEGSYLVFYGDTVNDTSYYAQRSFSTTMQAIPTMTVSPAAQAYFDGTIHVSSVTTKGFFAGRDASASVPGNWFHISWTAEVPV